MGEGGGGGCRREVNAEEESLERTRKVLLYEGLNGAAASMAFSQVKVTPWILIGWERFGSG